MCVLLYNLIVANGLDKMSRFRHSANTSRRSVECYARCCAKPPSARRGANGRCSNDRVSAPR